MSPPPPSWRWRAAWACAATSEIDRRARRYDGHVTGACTVLTALAFLQAQAIDQIVVTTAPSIDAQRLADALRVYLDEFGIRVETRPAGEADDLRKRLDDARQLGEALRAVAVVRAEHGARGVVEIELIDLATSKALVVSVPRPERDEDLYRALALKIQAVLRATLSEARADLGSAVVAGTARRRAPPARRNAPPGRRRAGRAHAAACPRRGLRGRVVPQRRAVVHGAGGPRCLASARAPRAGARDRGARIGDRVERNGRRDGVHHPPARHRAAALRRRADAAAGRPVRRRDVHPRVGHQRHHAGPVDAQRDDRPRRRS